MPTSQAVPLVYSSRVVDCWAHASRHHLLPREYREAGRVAQTQAPRRILGAAPFDFKGAVLDLSGSSQHKILEGRPSFGVSPRIGIYSSPRNGNKRTRVRSNSIVSSAPASSSVCKCHRAATVCLPIASAPTFSARICTTLGFLPWVTARIAPKSRSWVIKT